MINTDDIKVGDIFSTYTKLVSALGLENYKGKRKPYKKKK